VRILNGWAGIGGNRKNWGDEHEVTAVEFDPAIAAVYQKLYPNDTVIVGDAHEYLRLHYMEFDFIWASTVCKSHSRMRFHMRVQKDGIEAVYPDLRLYEVILFLRHHFTGGWVVENVIPYYEPLIPATKQINRHLYWSNFDIPAFEKSQENLRRAQIPDLEQLHGFDLSAFDLPNKREALRNCVPPAVGEHILDAYLGQLVPATGGGLLDLLTDQENGRQ
jgi:DNA (cytosine-5)-methyltransferase 1